MNRSLFRDTSVKTLGIRPPGEKADFDLEWQGGLYFPRIKKGISANFGSRIPTVAAEISCASFLPPDVIESRNFCYASVARIYTDEFCFAEPAKAMVKLFQTLELPLRYGMAKSEVEQHMKLLFGETVYGPDKPYKSMYTTDPNNWSRGYTPQPGDVSSSIISYKDGLLYLIGFWRQDLTSVEVIDVEIVAMNNVEDEPLLEIDLERPPRGFEAALELLHMTEALHDHRE